MFGFFAKMSEPELRATSESMRTSYVTSLIFLFQVSKRQTTSAVSNLTLEVQNAQEEKL